MIKENDIYQQLSHIIDPDLNKDIVSLGFVKNLKIEGTSVYLDIALTTPACPIKTEFQHQATELIKKIPGVKEVKINMVTQALIHSQSAQNIPSALSKVRSIIAISSCKGGVGKSTMAALISLELAQRGFKVGLVDCDIHGPSIPTLFNLQNVPVYANELKQLIPIAKHNLKIMSFGFLLGDGPAVMRGPIVTRYVQQILLATDWGELDYLFIDMPPGTGDVQLTITQTLRLSGAVIVTTRQTLSLVDVSRGILMFEKVDVPILGIIENMAYFICEQCHKKHYIFGETAGTSLLDRFGLPTIGEIPLMPQLTKKIEKPLANEYIITAVDQMIRALGKQSILKKQVPEIQFDKNYITLCWPEGESLKLDNRTVRAHCRCALCVNELTGEQLFKPENLKSDIAPKVIFPLGNYAIGIDWNDGHSSGIYPYRNLKRLAEGKTAQSPA